MYADIGLFRQSGLLDLIAGSQTAEEPEYKKFVEQTGFDYRTDLDAVAAAFRENGSYFLLRGRFQWRQLTDYARLQGGTCQYAICTMPGSTPERNISFYPVTRDVLALAVAKEVRGVVAIAPQESRIALLLPNEPIWISAPAVALRETTRVPSEWKALLSPAAAADRLTVALGPSEEHFQLRVDVACKTAEIAASVARELASMLELISGVAQQSGTQDNSSALGGVLHSGKFQQNDTRVTATWQVQRRLLENLFVEQGK